MTEVSTPEPLVGKEVKDGLPRRFGTNVLANYLAAAATIASGLVLTPLLIHHLGVEAFGVWALAGSVAVYLDLLDFGFGAATTKLVAEDAYVRPQGVIRTLNTSFWVLSLMGVIGLAVGLVMAQFVPDWFSVPHHLASAATVVVAVLAVSLATAIPGDTIGGALAGHQRYDLLALSNMFVAVSTSAVAVGVVLAGGGLIILAVSTALMAMLAHGLRWIMLRRLVPGLHLSPRLIDRHRLRRTTRLSMWFLVRDLAVTVVMRIDILVVGAFLGVGEIAVYAVGSKLAQLSDKILVPISQVFLPESSVLYRKGDHGGLSALLVDGTRLSLVVGVPITVVLVALSHPIVRVWVGPGFRGAPAILAVMAANFGIRAVTSSAGQLIAGVGWARAAANISVGEAAVNLTLSLALIGPLGAVGVAYGTLAGAALVDLPAMMLLACRAAQLPVRTLCRRALLPHVVPGALAIVAAVAGRVVWRATLAGLVSTTAAVLVVYAISYLALGATPAERQRLRNAAGSISGLAVGRTS